MEQDFVTSDDAKIYFGGKILNFVIMEMNKKNKEYFKNKEKEEFDEKDRVIGPVYKYYQKYRENGLENFIKQLKEKKYIYIDKQTKDIKFDEQNIEAMCNREILKNDELKKINNKGQYDYILQRLMDDVYCHTTLLYKRENYWIREVFCRNAVKYYMNSEYLQMFIEELKNAQIIVTDYNNSGVYTIINEELFKNFISEEVHENVLFNISNEMPEYMNSLDLIKLEQMLANSIREYIKKGSKSLEKALHL